MISVGFRLETLKFGVFLVICSSEMDLCNRFLINCSPEMTNNDKVETIYLPEMQKDKKEKPCNMIRISESQASKDNFEKGIV